MQAFKLPMDVFELMGDFYERKIAYTRVLMAIANHGLQSYYDPYNRAFLIRWENGTVSKHEQHNWRTSVEASDLEAVRVGLKKQITYDSFIGFVEDKQ